MEGDLQVALVRMIIDWRKVCHMSIIVQFNERKQLQC